MAEKVQVLVDGGKATAGPPIGPTLGALGINVGEVVKEINVKTASFEGMKVPVTISVDKATKKFTIEVGTPPTSSLILKELSKEKGSGKAGSEIIGNITMKQIINISKMKSAELMGKDVKKQVKEVVGTCQSLGVTVEGKNPKQIMKEIDNGAFDQLILS